MAGDRNGPVGLSRRMKDFPDFPRYTGVHPAPSPVRREEPDWEAYATKTVAERRAAPIRHDAVASWLESPE